MLRFVVEGVSQLDLESGPPRLSPCGKALSASLAAGVRDGERGWAWPAVAALDQPAHLAEGFGEVYDLAMTVLM